MRKKNRKILTLLLAVVLIIGSLTAGLTAGANGGTMDLDGDGAITIHDVQLAQEIKNNQRNASDRQIFALADYTVSEILDKVFGKSYTPSATSGVYQIKTLKDLYFIRDNASKSYSYKLVNDIDLGGADWTPIDDFAGTFDGNNKTISNLKITKGFSGQKTKTMLDMGFFSETSAGSVIKNLNLTNVEIDVTDEVAPNAQFIGLLVGTNRGTVTNCYTHGKITDQRETVTYDGTVGNGDITMIAALIGRCVGNGTYSTVSKSATQPEGIYLKSESSQADIKIAAQLAVDVAGRDDIHICLCGQGDPTSGATQFQDISGTYGVSETMQAKQDQVVDYMYEMGTVQWTTGTDLRWVKGADDDLDDTVENDTADSVWPAGTTQYGLPFTGMHSGLERFQSITTYNNGVYTIDPSKATDVQLGLISETDWYSSDNYDGEKDAEGNLLKDADGKLVDAEGNLITDTGYDGWIRYIGNDCSSAVSWAWLQVSPVDAYTNADGTVNGGGVYLDTCRHSFAYSELDENNANHYNHQHGLVQIGNYSFNKLDEDGNIVTAFYDATKASSSLPMEDTNRNGVLDAGEDLDGDGKLDYGGDGVGGTTATTSADIWDWNADESQSADNLKYAKLYEAYAQARKGDALQCWFTGLKSGTVYDGTNRIWEGHMRLIAEDPVVIRNQNGSIDIDTSYFITHEHGGGVNSRNTNKSNRKDVNFNSWSLYQKYAFTDLDYDVGKSTSQGGCRNANNSSRCYLPITCRALRTDEQVAQKYSYTDNPANGYFVDATAPYAGMIYTNYALSHVTVHVYDANGVEFITQTICALPEAGARSTQAQSRYNTHYQKQVDLTTQFAHLATNEEFESGAEYSFNFDLVGVTDTYDAASGTWTENSTITTKKQSFTYQKPTG